MAYAPIQLAAVPYEDYAGWWVKFYNQGTTTPLSMATDATGGTLIAQAEVSSGGTVPIGFIKTSGNALLVPYVNGDYDCWLFPTEAEATANDTTNAIQLADNTNADPASSINVDDASYTVADKTAAILLTPVSGKSLVVESSDGGLFIAKTGGAPSDYSDDGGAFCGTVFIPTGGDGSIAWVRVYSSGLNVRWFGMHPDTSAATNSSALQTLVDSLPNAPTNQPIIIAGGSVYIPSGKYDVSATLSITTDDRHITIYGDSNGSSILSQTTEGIATIEVLGTTAGGGSTKNFRCSQVKFQSANTTQNTGSSDIEITNHHYAEIDGCWFQGQSFAAIKMDNAIDCSIHHNRFDSTPGNADGYQSAIDASNFCNQLTIKQNYIEDTNFAGIRFDQCEKVSIETNLIQSNEQSGIRFDRCNALDIKGNYFESNGQSNIADVGDIIDDATNFSLGVSITKNHHSGDLSTATFYIMDIVDARGLVVDSNQYGSGVSPLIRIGAATLNAYLANNSSATDPTLTMNVSGGQTRFTNNKLTNGTYWTGHRDSERLLIRDASGDIASFPASVNPNAALGRYLRYGTITGALIINEPVNFKQDDILVVQWDQDGVGSHAVTFNAVFDVKTAVNAGISARNTYTFIFDANIGKYYELSNING